MTNPPSEFGNWPQPDDPSASIPPGRPAPLNLAVKLMYLGAVIGLVNFLPVLFAGDELRVILEERLRESGQQVTPELVDAAFVFAMVTAVLIGVVGAGLWVLMAVLNGRGRKGARMTATVLGGLGILANWYAVMGEGADLLSIAGIVLAGVILYLLWRPDNAPYYEANSRR